MSSNIPFQRLRWHLVRNGLHVLWQKTPLRLATMFAASFVVWLFVFGLSLGAFFELQRNVPLAGDITGTLFDLLFLSLFVMLAFSTGIILFSSLFTTPEAAFLLSTPARAERIFSYKFQAALGFSSWAFVLLGSPLLLAYGLVYKPSASVGVPWYFYALAPLFFFGFVLVPGSVGAFLCLVVVNVVPRRRKQALVACGLLVVAIAGFVVYKLIHTIQSGTMDRDMLQRLLGQVSFAGSIFTPSHWMTRGILAAARRDLGGSLYNLALLWSNGLFFLLVTTATAARLYRRGYNRLATGSDFRRRPGGYWLDTLLSGALRFLDPKTRLLIIKDFRAFRRDPAQYAQVALFSGLMILYLLNLGRFDIGWQYTNGLSLMNVCVIGLLLCTYTGRFIYPMLSLEGRRFWILGLLPLERERLLWGKFAFSAATALGLCLGLIVFGDLMLGMPWLVIGIHALTVVALALGLSGLSVGMGACLPNFQERDPSKIAVGFGGTLNLVAGLFYLLVVTCVMAGPWHLQALLSKGPQALADQWTGWIVAGGILLGTAITLAAVLVPLRMGIQALREMEF